RQLLAPILVLICWNLLTGVTFTLDNYIIAAAQVIYMIRIGIQIAKLLDQMKGRIALAIAFQNVLLILLAFVMVLFIAMVSDHSVNELFLGAAPGGMSQIVLVAIETGADVALISSYHIFRIFFILFLIAPLLSYFLKYRLAKDSINKKS
ncbi:AbrB family transcriptional regulator, partial [Staphylococcus xylosus]